MFVASMNASKILNEVEQIYWNMFSAFCDFVVTKGGPVLFFFLYLLISIFYIYIFKYIAFFYNTNNKYCII